MTTSPASARSLICRSPEDVLAAVPVILGFEPAESLVMLTFGGRETFHARVDLPPDETRSEEVIGLLLEPARQHLIRRVMFVAYSTRAELADSVLDGLRGAFVSAGIEVGMDLRADGTQWFLPGQPGVPYDVAAHRFRVDSVLEGQVVSRSREELAARLEPTAGVALVEKAARRAVPATPTEVAVAVWRALGHGRFENAELAAVLLGMQHVPGRDAAWSGMGRDDAAQHVELWTDAVQRSPAQLVGGPAAVLAFASWLAGNGALAWCAVDRCLEVEPDNSLADLVSELLGRAVPPSTWGEGAALSIEEEAG